MTDRTEEQERDSVPAWCPKCGRRAGTCTCEPFKRLRKKVRRLRDQRDEAREKLDEICRGCDDLVVMGCPVHDAEGWRAGERASHELIRERDRLERAARETIRELDRGYRRGTLQARGISIDAARTRLRRALDESEGRGGGEEVVPMDVCPYNSPPDAPGCFQEVNTSEWKVRGFCPVHAEDAEDDGRGEGIDEVLAGELDWLAKNCRMNAEDAEKRGDTDMVVLWTHAKDVARRAARQIRTPTHSDADPELADNADDVRQQSDEELVDALESLARNFCLEAGLGYAPVNLAGLEIKRRLQNRSDADPSGEEGDPWDKALHDILRERERQDMKWGSVEERDYLDRSDLLAILGEEFGELCEAVLEHRFGEQESSDKGLDLRGEAVQVAATGMMIVEWLDAQRRTEDAGEEVGGE